MTIRIIIIFFSLLSYCYAQQNGNQKMIIKEGIGIEGIVTMNETKKDIKKKYGKPDPFLYTKYRKMAVTHPYNKRSAKTVTIQKVGRPRNTFYYKKIELQISFGNDNLVNGIYIITDKYQTSKGLSIGDSREKAYKLYREGDSCQPILQVNNEGIDIYFDRCNKVEKIRIYTPH